ncbi:MAG: hypothetical protein Tsb0020_54560 [Haliangiales bacterium]
MDPVPPDPSTPPGRDQLIEDLRAFIVREVLDGDGLGLDQNTPLLQYGIINSITLVSLLAFIEQRFSLTIPAAELVPNNLVNLETIAELLLRQQDTSA